MTGADREVELKFTCAPEDLATVLAAAPPGDDETRELISVYFDTPDLALQKAGASLRVRESEGRRVQTLKRGEGLVREEHEAAIDGLAPDPELGPLPKLIPEGTSLRPAFNIRVSRRQRSFGYRDAQIELALDQGEVTGGDQQSPICEVELELKSGPPATLFDLARELAAAAPLYLSYDSKAKRGQALVAGDTDAPRKNGKVELVEDATVGKTFQAVARKALAQIAANGATLRAKPEAEAVHQLRVGARRFRSALTTFKPALEGKGFEAVKNDLRWLSHSCDRSRNLDVFSEEILRPAERGEDRPPGLAPLRKAIDAARRRAWADVAETVSSGRFRALMIDAAAWVETGDWLAGDSARSPIASFAANALKRHLRKVEKRGQEAEGADDLARHHLRIEAKKLRYATEAFESLYGGARVKRFLKPVKNLQEVLGALNDLATAKPMLDGLALPSAAALVAGQLVGLRAAAKPQLVARAAQSLADLEDAKRPWR